MCRVRRKWILQAVCTFVMPHLPCIIKGKQGEKRGFEETNTFGPSANMHSGSKDGSQAELKSGVQVDRKVCGIQAVKGTVIKPYIPSSLI